MKQSIDTVYLNVLKQFFTINNGELSSLKYNYRMIIIKVYNIIFKFDDNIDIFDKMTDIKNYFTNISDIRVSNIFYCFNIEEVRDFFSILLIFKTLDFINDEKSSKKIIVNYVKNTINEINNETNLHKIPFWYKETINFIINENKKRKMSFFKKFLHKIKL